ncbi:MAG: radical SAM protein [Armatimonadetes bacterium CG07_land_8_20_14_0_80_40_9]|nr:MAG: radical SAM protein [Armatimonadetes bacterium CG07_land_8_20_14_0_80_40_9]
MFKPGYLNLFQSGELKKRIEKAYQILKSCQLCPRNCKVNRLEGELGFCRSGLLPKVSSFSPHFGEEAPLVGRHGSGTIFFTNCNLGCIFCQNYEISHLGKGEEVTKEELSKMMLHLQSLGCHNINFVTPTHFVPQILAALELAVKMGLNVPLVYNCGGYEAKEVIALLEGIFDIYMPDIKYEDSEVSKKYSKAEDYPQIVKVAVKEMHRQVGDLILDGRGIAKKGLLVRHLVLPEGLAGTKGVMQYLAREVSLNTYVNIMDQYHPCYQAEEYPEIKRPISRAEYREAVDFALEEGISRLD